MRAVELHLLPEDGSFPGIDTTFATLGAVSREAVMNLGWHSDGSYTLLYRLTVTDFEPLETAIEDNEDIRQYELIVEDETNVYAFLHVSEHEILSELLAITEEHALLLEPPFRFTERGVRVTVAGEQAALQEAFDEVSDRIAVDVEWMGGYSPDRTDTLGRLTHRQREALSTAHELGYYETPREVSFEEVAAELDCASSTANELLRRAESKIIDSILAE
ncbi:helix-turn-helix domain-containing protein [Halovenus sp. HT40]|uniref:helix-turn-helix domain-containing protein n=1 Tax=Halovenus sp. HT40 TaxID=3126691 RepID=UPI00300EFD47